MPTTDAQTLTLQPPFVAMKWYKGSALPFNVIGVDDAGDPTNLTGATAKMQVKNGAGTVVLTLETGGAGIVLSDPTAGQMTISPEVVGTSSLSTDILYTYDLKVTLADASVTPWFRGTITVIEKITL